MAKKQSSREIELRDNPLSDKTMDLLKKPNLPDRFKPGDLAQVQFDDEAHPRVIYITRPGERITVLDESNTTRQQLLDSGIGSEGTMVIKKYGSGQAVLTGLTVLSILRPSTTSESQTS